MFGIPAMRSYLLHTKKNDNQGVIGLQAKAYKIWKEAVVFYIGGMFYCLVELLWRGWTHGSMFLLGALCFYVVGGMDRYWHAPVVVQMAVGALIVTFFEFWTGVLVNMVLHMNVWTYSHLPFNLLGQICLPFTLLWFPLCGIGILLENLLRHLLFGEPVPQYRWVI